MAGMKQELLTTAATEVSIYLAQAAAARGAASDRAIHAPARRLARTLVRTGVGVGWAAWTGRPGSGGDARGELCDVARRWLVARAGGAKQRRQGAEGCGTARIAAWGVRMPRPVRGCQ